MTILSLSPTIITWAAQQLGASVDDLALALGSPKKVERFKKGQLTQTQATKLAAQLRIPFGYLFLANPPVRQRATLPDLRQTPNPEALSDAFFDVLQDIETKLAWYLVRLAEGEAEPLKFVGKFRGIRELSASVVAEDIARTIGFTPQDRASCANAEELCTALTKRFEACRILVFRSGIVRANTRRPIPVSEFRGFAIANTFAPVIFINGRDAPAAWVFTLLHEAAHIWIGESGVSDNSASTAVETRGIEAFCNQVAAEFLTPSEEFSRIWNLHRDAHIIHLARHFKVSRLVIAKRALYFGLIGRDLYQQVVAASQPSVNEDGGGNPYATIPIRSSRRFTEAVLNSAMSGETMLREAGKLLNIQPSTVVELYRRQNEPA